MIETLLDDLTAAELIDEVYVREDAAEDAAQRLYEAQAMLIAKMEENGSTELLSDSNIAKLTTKGEYDQVALRVLFETDDVTYEELVEAGAYIPEYQKTVEARFNATKLKPFGKRGGEVRGIIEGARRTGRTTVRVTPR